MATLNTDGLMDIDVNMIISIIITFLPHFFPPTFLLHLTILFLFLLLSIFSSQFPFPLSFTSIFLYFLSSSLVQYFHFCFYPLFLSPPLPFRLFSLLYLRVLSSTFPSLLLLNLLLSLSPSFIFTFIRSTSILSFSSSLPFIYIPCLPLYAST